MLDTTIFGDRSASMNATAKPRCATPIRVAVACAILSSPALATAAEGAANPAIRLAQAKITFNLPAQPLAESLRAVAAETGSNILFDRSLVSGLTAQPLQAELSLREALVVLLKDTELDYQRVDDRTVMIVSTKATTDRKTTLAGAKKTFWRVAQLSQARDQTSVGAEQSAGNSALRSGASIEEVVVTAQKREEKLQDVPISMTVMSGRELESGTISSMNDALRTIPGFAGYENSQAGMTRYSVRGVSTNPSLFNSSSVVGFYLDEIPFGFVRFPVVPDANAFDMERVEALRGPQGTLYGASSLNGVIRIVTRDADLDSFGFKARTNFSSTKDGGENYRGDAAINVPLVPGKLAMRAVVGYEEEGGWIDLPLAGRKDANDLQSTNARLKFNAQPTENLAIELMSWISRTDRGYPATSRDDRTSQTATWAEWGLDTNFDAHGLIVTYDFPFASLFSSTSLMNFDSKGSLDTGPNILTTEMEGDLLAQEFRLTSNTAGPWKWSLGGIFRNAEDTLIQHQFIEATGLPHSQVQYRQIYESKSYAFFGELGRQFFGNRLEFTVGLRYFEDETSGKETSAYDFVDGSPIPPAGESPLVKSDALTSRVVLTYRPSEATSFYASFSEGFRAGFAQNGVVVRTVPQDSVRFLPVIEPDKLRNYEIGSKGTRFDGRLDYDLAIYYIDWKDAVQVQAVFPPGSAGLFAPINSEGVDGMGMDIGLSARLSNRFRASLSFSWNELEFTESVLNGADVLYPKGSRPPESSRRTAGADISYIMPLGSSYTGEFVAGVSYTDELVTAGASGPTVGDDLVMASVAFNFSSDSGWTASLFVDNLTDEDGRIRPAASLISSESDRLRPRTIGVQLEYSFR